MTDEEYVRSKWKDVENYKDFGMYVSLRSDSETVSTWSSWYAAAEFTRNRMEEIRQVEREIEVLESWITNRLSWILPINDSLAWEGPGLANKARYVITYSRILAREQAALDELKRGMKA